MAVHEVLRGKMILAVDDEEDVLEFIRDELFEAADCTLHLATTFEKAHEYLISYSYDLVIVDIMGVRGFDLLKIAANRNFPVVMLTAHALNLDALKKSIELGARAFLPKDRLGSLVPFLEDVLRLSYQSVWKMAFEHVEGLFTRKYGPDWRKSMAEFWQEFEKKQAVEDATIIR